MNLTKRIWVPGLAGLVLSATLALTPVPAAAQVTAFRQAVAENVSDDEALAAFYRDRDFAGLWTGQDDAAQDRRNALLAAFADAWAHGLPAQRYDPQALMARLRSAATPAERGAMEVELSRLFLRYASDIGTGILQPGAVVGEIKREVPQPDRLALLSGLAAAAEPRDFLRGLPPQSPEYTRLMREKLRLELLLDRGGWGEPVVAGKLEPGDTGEGVIALRNRLIRMGFLDRTATATYDAAIKAAVEEVQQAHGLTVDGTAGEETLREINRSPEDRIGQIIVAMERERWTNFERGDRHVWVNLTDFSARIVDHDIVTFETRSVIGATSSDRQSPEFSDEMEFMVINPSWYVPRSIATKEYLPQLQRNPGAVSHLIITDRSGRQVNRGAVNFSGYTAANFPYSMRQARGPATRLAG